MKLSLRNRLLWPVVSVTCLSLLTAGTVSFFNSRQALSGNMEQLMNQLLTATGRQIETWFGDRKLDVENWAGMEVFQTALLDSFMGKAARQTSAGELEQLLVKYPYYESISLVNSNGLVVSSSNTNVTDKLNIADRDYFQQAMRGKTVMSDAMASRITGLPILVVTTAVQEKGQVKGVLFAALDLTAFQRKFVAPVKLLKQGYVFVYDRTGQVFSHSDASLALKMRLTEFDWGKEMLQGKTGQIRYRHAGAENIASHQFLESLGYGLAVVEPEAEFMEPIHRSAYISLVVVTLSILVSVGIVLLVTRSITRPLQRMIQRLEAGSGQITASAQRMAASSQSLAEGANEQAASLEETSSSIQVMRDQAQRTTTLAAGAGEMMNENLRKSSASLQAIVNMNQGMESMRKASGQMLKIIHTIDDIAMQTNLLALNAAVEAARAGQAGAGFSVVAEEVRSLARKSAEAAKSTQALLESLAGRITESGQAIQGINDNFEAIVETATAMGEKIVLISDANKEIAAGMAQINEAGSQASASAQNVAATSEETRAASEEFSAQALDMKNLALSLQLLVAGEEQSSSPGPARE